MSIVNVVLPEYQIYAATITENIVAFPEGIARLNRVIALVDFQNKTASRKNGTDTILTKEFDDNGTLLSGGEARKIANARLFAMSDHFHDFILDNLSGLLDTYAETMSRLALQESG